MNGKSNIMNLAHSNGERRASISMTSIKILFADISPIQLQIKHAMKTSAPIQNKGLTPSLFQIAARIDDFVPATNSKSLSTCESAAFAELMLHREKLDEALRIAKSENDAFDASRKFSQSPTKRATCSRARLSVQ